MRSCAPGEGRCSATFVSGMLSPGRSLALHRPRHQPTPDRAHCSCRFRSLFWFLCNPSPMLDISNASVLRLADDAQANSASGKSLAPLFRWILMILSLAGVLLVPPLAYSQDQEEIKGAPAEPTDAQEIREQIAAVQKILPTLPDRAAALYFLAAAKQHLRETREALALLKECIALQEGFDPSGEPAFIELKSTKEFTTLIESVHRDFPVIAQAREAFRTTEKD